MLPTSSLPGHLASSAPAQTEPTVALAAPSVDQQAAKDTTGLSGGALAGIVVGSVLGGVLLLVLLALLIRCLCQRRQTPTDHTTRSGAKTVSSGGWSCFGSGRVFSTWGRRVPPPRFGSDKQDPDEISDTSFVLPELGGPNPHNKFDGMEWVDIKGLDDEHLQDISTDLRKYSQGQRR